jgi:hypothetical protein
MFQTTLKIINCSNIAFLLADLKSHLKTKCSGLELASADFHCGFSNGKKMFDDEDFEKR